MQAFLDITGALADENRVRAMLALSSGELCVCQITELLQLAPSTVSKHLSILKSAGLVDSRKQGRWIHYRLRDDPTPMAAAALEMLRKCLCEDPAVSRDSKRVLEILKMDPEVLCDQQSSKCCSSAPATRVALKWRKASRGPSAAK